MLLLLLCPRAMAGERAREGSSQQQGQQPAKRAAVMRCLARTEASVEDWRGQQDEEAAMIDGEGAGAPAPRISQVQHSKRGATRCCRLSSSKSAPPAAAFTPLLFYCLLKWPRQCHQEHSHQHS